MLDAAAPAERGRPLLEQILLHVQDEWSRPAAPVCIEIVVQAVAPGKRLMRQDEVAALRPQVDFRPIALGNGGEPFTGVDTVVDNQHDITTPTQVPVAPADYTD